MKKTDRLGETKLNNEKCLMQIVEYSNAIDIVVEFVDEFKAKVHSGYNKFLSGEIKNPYNRSVYGVGYIGIGNYKSCINKKNTIQYDIWHAMLKRCYSTKYQGKYQTYKDCEVSEEWHNFQVFAKWFDENYYAIDNEKMCLDKDILCKGNKIYSPKACIFVSDRINNLFIKCDKARGDCPVGVCFKKNINKYRSQLNVNNNKQYIGLYDTQDEAFQAYKISKENYIKQIANEYKNKIPKKLYDAMIEYEVNIND